MFKKEIYFILNVEFHLIHFAQFSLIGNCSRKKFEFNLIIQSISPNQSPIDPIIQFISILIHPHPLLQQVCFNYLFFIDVFFYPRTLHFFYPRTHHFILKPISLPLEDRISLLFNLNLFFPLTTIKAISLDARKASFKIPRKGEIDIAINANLKIILFNSEFLIKIFRFKPIKAIQIRKSLIIKLKVNLHHPRTQHYFTSSHSKKNPNLIYLMICISFLKPECKSNKNYIHHFNSVKIFELLIIKTDLKNIKLYPSTQKNNFISWHSKKILTLTHFPIYRFNLKINITPLTYTNHYIIPFKVVDILINKIILKSIKIDDYDINMQKNYIISSHPIKINNKSINKFLFIKKILKKKKIL